MVHFIIEDLKEEVDLVHQELERLDNNQVEFLFVLHSRGTFLSHFLDSCNVFEEDRNRRELSGFRESSVEARKRSFSQGFFQEDKVGFATLFHCRIPALSSSDAQQTSLSEMVERERFDLGILVLSVLLNNVQPIESGIVTGDGDCGLNEEDRLDVFV